METIERWVSERDDTSLELAVLTRALDARPERLTVDEMVRELAGEQAGDEVHQAVLRVAGNLADVVLIQPVSLQEHDLIEPTRAAIRYKELSER